jgi:hypothetical protein
VTEVDVTTIAVPKQADYEDAGKVFEQMAFGLLSAADQTRHLDFRPGNFREGQDLQYAVDRFCQDRQDILEVYSEACKYIGEIIRLCGETYNGAEQQRVDKGSDLDSRIGSALKGLQRLHGELDKIRQRPSDPGPAGRDRDPRYQIMSTSDVEPLGPNVPTGLGPVVKDYDTGGSKSA